ncbi:cysteine-rich receptor-like protein kinase 15 isoform X2 [Carex rostrata]
MTLSKEQIILVFSTPKATNMASHSRPQCSLLLFLLFFATIFQLATSAIILLKCSESNFTTNSTYQSNRSQLLSNLSSAGWRTGFSFQTLGEDTDQVFGRALCLIQINSSDCQTCLLNAVEAIKSNCTRSIRAGLWYDNCFVRYSDTNSITADEKSWSHTVYALYQISNPEKFGEVYSNLMGSLADRVVNSTNLFKVNTANYTGNITENGVVYTGNITLYGLVQCIRDISPHDCYTCLEQYIGQFQASAYGQQCGATVGFQCYIRMETYQYFNLSLIDATPPALPPELPPLTKKSTGGKRRRLIIIISVSVALLIIGCFIGLLLIRKLRYTEEEMLTNNNKTLDLWSRERSADFPLFDFNEIANATSNFALDNKLGEGGFGPVYKGVLQDGLEIAVKRLSTYSGQGLVEFNNEIQLIAKLQHRNLVRLVGWCIQGEEKILIYEFMPNKSLDYFIFDETRRVLLNWERRFEIIEGIGQGLLYLHKHSRLRIVHRDLKASNVLLDAEMNPKISDFGLARIFGPKELQANTNRVVGTHGYMAPEYASEGLFSMKSDVFSFGVLLLEIVSGKRNVGFHRYGHFLNLLGYAWVTWKDGSISELICPTLTQVSQRQIERCIHVALLCVQENQVDRPIMSDVIMFLTTETIILPEPKQPAYFNVSVTEDAAGSCSINYVTLTNLEVR